MPLSLDVPLDVRRSGARLLAFTTNNPHRQVAWPVSRDAETYGLQRLDATPAPGPLPRSHLVVVLQHAIENEWGLVCQNKYAYAVWPMEPTTSAGATVQLAFRSVLEKFRDHGTPAASVSLRVAVRPEAVLTRGPALVGLPPEQLNREYDRLDAGCAPRFPGLERTGIPIYFVNGVNLPGWAFFLGTALQKADPAWVTNLGKLACLHVFGRYDAATAGALADRNRVPEPRFAQWVQALCQIYSNACLYRTDYRYAPGARRNERVESFDYLPATDSGDCEDLAWMCVAMWLILQRPGAAAADAPLDGAFRRARAFALLFTPYAALVDVSHGSGDAHMTAYAVSNRLVGGRHVLVGLDGIHPCRSFVARQDMPALEELARAVRATVRDARMTVTHHLDAVCDHFDGPGSDEETRTIIVRMFKSPLVGDSDVHSRVPLLGSKVGLPRYEIDNPKVVWNTGKTDPDTHGSLLAQLAVREPFVVLGEGDSAGRAPFSLLHEWGARAETPRLTLNLVAHAQSFEKATHWALLKPSWLRDHRVVYLAVYNCVVTDRVQYLLIHIQANAA